MYISSTRNCFKPLGRTVAMYQTRFPGISGCRSFLKITSGELSVLASCFSGHERLPEPWRTPKTPSLLRCSRHSVALGFIYPEQASLANVLALWQRPHCPSALLFLETPENLWPKGKFRLKMLKYTVSTRFCLFQWVSNTEISPSFWCLSCRHLKTGLKHSSSKNFWLKFVSMELSGRFL